MTPGAMKILVIGMGVIIAALLVVLIFVPPRNAAPVPTGNSTSTGSGTDGTLTGTVTSTLPGGDRNGGADQAVYYNYTTAKGRTVKATIAPNQKITNPLTFTGNVPAGWAFEGSFPIDIRDANGAVIGHGTATVPNWMSTTTAWYSATISFGRSSSGNPLTPTGLIVLYNDNPSGLARNADAAEIPVKF